MSALRRSVDGDLADLLDRAGHVVLRASRLMRELLLSLLRLAPRNKRL